MKTLNNDICRAFKAFLRHLGEIWQAILIILRVEQWTPPPNEIDVGYFTTYFTKEPVDIKIIETIPPCQSPWLFWREGAKFQIILTVTILHKIGLSFWKKLVFVVIPDQKHPEKNIYFVVKEVSKRQVGHGRWGHTLFLEPESLIANLDSLKFIADPQRPAATLTMKIANNPAEIKSLTFHFGPQPQQKRARV
ncbi:MAG: hypothetical protein Q8M83_04410 [bacterium]|nr:hypothetical protein [bacterium]